VELHRVELECFEMIEDRGTRRVSWQIESKGSWTQVSDVGGAEQSLEERAPGTVWRRRFVVQLPSGARLMRVESGPAVDVRSDPMDYLLGARRSPRRLMRRYFIVGERGQLVRQEP
jgi:hypothetical protein